MKNIPSQIKDIAKNEGCNHIEFVGNIDNKDIYCISEIGDDGLFVPRGLPTLVSWNEKNYNIITGEDSLELLGTLQ